MTDTINTMRQPKALYVLACVQMWECFSFYGMRALLVLYMINQMQLTDMQAFGIYAVYSGLTDLGSVVGGVIADKLLGLRRAIMVGGWLIAAGHIMMAVEAIDYSLFIGLALIVIGTSLFTTNISALLGLYYNEGDTRREEGYTLFYMSINIGALLASIVCGAVAEIYGWHYGFGLAAIGMIAGNIAFISCKGILKDKGLVPERTYKSTQWMLPLALIAAVLAIAIGISHGETLLPILPLLSMGCIGYISWKLVTARSIPRIKLVMLVVFLTALAIFYAAEEQIGSSLMVLSERFASRTLFGIEMPASFLLGVNPATIILLGPFINRLCRYGFKQQNGDSWRLITAFGLAAGAFAFIGYSCAFPDAAGQVMLLPLVMSVIVISGAELLVGPAVYSFCSELAPEKQQGTVMGLVSIGFSLASFGGGSLSTLMAPEGEVATLPVYSMGYILIAGLLGVTGLAIAIATPLLSRYPYVEEKAA